MGDEKQRFDIFCQFHTEFAILIVSTLFYALQKHDENVQREIEHNILLEPFAFSRVFSRPIFLFGIHSTPKFVLNVK